MLGVGCTYNDMIDRKIDAKVTRTKQRPIPSGKVSVKKAWIFLGAQMGLAFILFLLLSPFAKIVALGCLPFLFLYPYMKRITFFPHLFVGIILNYGVLLSWAQTYGEITLSPVLVYLGCLFWSAGYDATYAIQDKKDDKKSGVKSAPLKLGKNIKKYLYGVYGAMLVLTMLGAYGQMNAAFFIIYPLAWAALPGGVYKMNIKKTEAGFSGFHANRRIGAGILLAFIIGII